jgi:ketosteroid isomerase-like protein
MTNEEIANIMRDFVQTMAKGDVEKTLSFFTEDGVFITPNGTFKGQDELRRHLSAEAESMQDRTATETGNGIIVEGNKAFFEHVLGATVQGRRAEFLAMCAYEFSNGKIKEVRTTYDRLLIAQQAVKGWLPKMLVNFIVKQSEKM